MYKKYDANDIAVVCLHYYIMDHIVWPAKRLLVHIVVGITRFPSLLFIHTAAATFYVELRWEYKMCQ